MSVIAFSVLHRLVSRATGGSIILFRGYNSPGSDVAAKKAKRIEGLAASGDRNERSMRRASSEHDPASTAAAGRDAPRREPPKQSKKPPLKLPKQRKPPLKDPPAPGDRGDRQRKRPPIGDPPGRRRSIRANSAACIVSHSCCVYDKEQFSD